MRRFLSRLARSMAVLLAAAAAPGIPAAAELFHSPTGQPGVVALAGEDFTVSGYLSARFGMTPAEVRGAIAADFGAGAPVVDEVDPVEGTANLKVPVARLGGEGRPALVTYVFGASGGRLFTVNVVWATAADAAPEDRAAVVRTAAAEAGVLQGYGWMPFTTVTGLVSGPNGVIVFAGSDAAGGGVEVRLEGVQLELMAEDGTRATGRPPSGPTYARLALTADAQNPDVARLPPGSF